MTQIEAKMMSARQETIAGESGAGATLLDQQTFDLFSQLFSQMRLEPVPETETKNQTCDSETTYLPENPLMDDVYQIESLTQLLVITQQLVEKPASDMNRSVMPLENEIFTDKPIVADPASAIAVIQQAAETLLAQKQRFSIDGVPNQKQGYAMQREAVPALIELLQKITDPTKPVSKLATDIQNGDSEATAKLAVAMGMPSTVDTEFDQMPTVVHGPPQASGRGPVPIQLTRLVQGPVDANGRGPAVPQIVPELQGPPQANGQGPLIPNPIPNVQVPPQAKAELPPVLVLTKSPNMNMQPTPPNGEAPLPETDGTRNAQKPEPFASRPYADANPVTKVKDQIISSSKAQHAKQIDASVVVRPMTGPVKTDPIVRSTNGELISSGENTTAQSPQTQSQGGQSGGQSDRGGQTFTNADAKSAGAERTAVYRLNVQQSGWGDAMVRRIQTGLQNGTNTVRIILEPGNLGRLQITMGLRQGKATVRVAADTAQAASLLQESRAHLAQLFDQAGMRLTSLQTAASSSGGEGGHFGEGGSAQMTSDQQSAGHNANKDGKNSEHDNKLSVDGKRDQNADTDVTASPLAPGETAVLNVLA